MRTVTHKEWIQTLESTCSMETGEKCKEGKQEFEDWLHATPVKKILKMLKTLEKEEPHHD